MAKPILVVKLPNTTTQEQLEDTSKMLNNQDRGIGTEYHCLVCTQNQSNEILFEVYYEKDFNEVKYEELKQIIKEQINNKQNEQTNQQG